jgi:hypothetical protein
VIHPSSGNSPRLVETRHYPSTFFRNLESRDYSTPYLIHEPDHAIRFDETLAGPTLEAIEDGSKVIGTQIEKTSAPKDGGIPRLLLKRKAGVGKGRFSRGTYIQRVDTERGIAPPGHAIRPVKVRWCE